jgi:hypothetical protein
MGAERRTAAGLLAAAALFSIGCDTLVGPSGFDDNWRVHESPHFLLHARPGSFADLNARHFGEVLEDQYAWTLHMMAAQYDGRVSGFLYESASDSGRLHDRSGTGYPATEAFSAVCTPPLEDGLLGLLGHESNHVVLWNALGRPGTSLMNEGLASAVLSERYHRVGRHFLYPWTRANRGRLPSIATLADDSRWGLVESQLAYNASASFLAYLLETYGTDRLRQLYDVTSSDFTRRFAEIYGRPLEEVEADWVLFCFEWVED